MYKSNCGNENLVLPILFRHLPDDLKYTDLQVELEDCVDFADGIYLFQDMHIPWEWGYNDEYVNEFDPKNKVDEILRFAKERFGTNIYEPEFRKEIAKSSSNPGDRSFDFVVIQLKDGHPFRWVTFEVASEDHFEGSTAIRKTISDCLKNNGSKTHTIIIDARKRNLPTLEQQVLNGLELVI